MGDAFGREREGEFDARDEGGRGEAEDGECEEDDDVDEDDAARGAPEGWQRECGGCRSAHVAMVNERGGPAG